MGILSETLGSILTSVLTAGGSKIKNISEKVISEIKEFNDGEFDKDSKRYKKLLHRIDELHLHLLSDQLFAGIDLAPFAFALDASFEMQTAERDANGRNIQAWETIFNSVFFSDRPVEALLDVRYKGRIVGTSDKYCFAIADCMINVLKTSKNYYSPDYYSRVEQILNEQLHGDPTPPRNKEKIRENDAALHNFIQKGKKKIAEIIKLLEDESKLTMLKERIESI